MEEYDASGYVYVLDVSEAYEVGGSGIWDIEHGDHADTVGEKHYKVGMTSKKSYLSSRASRCRTNYKMSATPKRVFEIETINAEMLEQVFHIQQAYYRVGAREVFRIDLLKIEDWLYSLNRVMEYEMLEQGVLTRKYSFWLGEGMRKTWHIYDRIERYRRQNIVVTEKVKVYNLMSCKMEGCRKTNEKVRFTFDSEKEAIRLRDIKNRKAITLSYYIEEEMV